MTYREELKQDVDDILREFFSGGSIEGMSEDIEALVVRYCARIYEGCLDAHLPTIEVIINDKT